MKKLIALCIASMLILAPGLVALADTPTVTPPPAIPTISNVVGIGGTDESTIAPPLSCGSVFDPCGPPLFNPIVFPTLNLPSPTFRPTLPSPTPIPISVTPSPTFTLTPSYTATNTFTPTLSPTPTGTLTTLTPSVTSTPTVDTRFGDIETMLAQNQSSLNTLAALGTMDISVSGTPQTIAIASTAISANVGNVFSAIYGIKEVGAHNKTLAIVLFLFACFSFVMLVNLGTLIVPMILAIIRWILEIIRTIKP